MVVETKLYSELQITLNQDEYKIIDIDGQTVFVVISAKGSNDYIIKGSYTSTAIIELQSSTESTFVWESLQLGLTNLDTFTIDLNSIIYSPSFLYIKNNGVTPLTVCLRGNR